MKEMSQSHCCWIGSRNELMECWCSHFTCYLDTSCILLYHTVSLLCNREIATGVLCSYWCPLQFSSHPGPKVPLSYCCGKAFVVYHQLSVAQFSKRYSSYGFLSYWVTTVPGVGEVKLIPKVAPPFTGLLPFVFEPKSKKMLLLPQMFKFKTNGAKV